MSCLQRLHVALLALALSACATNMNLGKLPDQAAGTSQADIVALVGAPESTHQSTDGSQYLIYSTQPTGTQCFLLQFDKDKRLVSVEDTLSQAGRDKVQPGMTREALMARMCRPMERMTTAHPYEVLGWNMQPLDASTPRVFDVYLQDGLVIRSEVRTLYFQAMGTGR